MKRLSHYWIALAEALWDVWALYLGVGAAGIGYMFAPDDLLLRVIATVVAFAWALALITGKAKERANWQKAITDARMLHASHEGSVEWGEPLSDPPLWFTKPKKDADVLDFPQPPDKSA